MASRNDRNSTSGKPEPHFWKTESTFRLKQNGIASRENRRIASRERRSSICGKDLNRNLAEPKPHLEIIGTADRESRNCISGRPESNLGITENGITGKTGLAMSTPTINRTKNTSCLFFSKFQEWAKRIPHTRSMFFITNLNNDQRIICFICFLRDGLGKYLLLSRRARTHLVFSTVPIPGPCNNAAGEWNSQRGGVSQEGSVRTKLFVPFLTNQIKSEDSAKARNASVYMSYMCSRKCSSPRRLLLPSYTDDSRLLYE